MLIVELGWRYVLNQWRNKIFNLSVYHSGERPLSCLRYSQSLVEFLTLNELFLLQLVRQLVSKGSTVYATARKPDAAKELKKLADNAGVQISCLDVNSPTSIQEWARNLRQTVNHIDLLINNAGILEASDLMEVTAEEMVEAFRVNAVGPLLVTQQLIKHGLLGKPGTSIVANMSSRMGSVEDNGSGGYYSYRASKSALNVINKSLAIDLAPRGVTCIDLHPGYVRTDMTGHRGTIDAQSCAAGLLKVLESDKPTGTWWDYKGEEVPW